MAAPLFACTKCNSRHPFEELSSGQQLCKDCVRAFPVVKCTYCRTEFQECFKGSTSVCKKCDANIKHYGKPSACEYCNIIAAFIGSKCQRCTNSEKKYGPPVTCDQCKQRCAFDRKDDSRKKVDGKLLCWLCTLAYKRALAKAKQNSSTRHSSSMSLNKSSHHHSRNHKRSHSHSGKTVKTEPHTPSKKPKTEPTKLTNGSLPASNSTSLLDPNMSDHVIALTQLKDEIAQLQKQLLVKDQQMLMKDKQMSELKAQYGVQERELRLKIQEMNKSHTDILDELQSKNRVLQKQVVTLTKLTKKSLSATNSPQRL